MVIKQNYFELYEWRNVSRSIVRDAVKDILSIARDKLTLSTKKLKVLDVGCGVGSYAFEIEKYVTKVVGVEPYAKVYDQALLNKKRYHSKVAFVKKTIEEFNTSERFDLVLSLTSIEHMSDADKSFKKIFSLLKKGGIVYLTAPNKYWPIEQHYGLPFLSYLSLPLANFYIRLTGKANSYEDCSYSRSYFGMQYFFDQFPCSYEFHLPEDLGSNYVGLGNKSTLYNMIKKVGMKLINKYPQFWMFSKGFIMVIRKS